MLTPLAGSDVIVRRHPGYQLQAPPDAIDAHRFERLVEEGLQYLAAGDRATGTARMRSALALWRGPALSDFTYEEFAQPSIRRLTDRHLDAIEELAGAELAAGLTADAMTLVEAAVREDPLRERSREILMLALYRSGRHAEALRTYQRLRELLVEELGLDPSPSLQRLQQRILLHDPTLTPTVAGPSVSTRPPNPYKGLRSFTEDDAQDFFGRDALVERLVDALRAGHRLIAVVGPSGSGKSSVVRAGLIPRVRDGEIPGFRDVAVASLMVGEDPLGDVEAAITEAATEPSSRDVHVLLVIDQFEDLFSVASDEARRRFLGWLTERLTSGARSLTVVLTLRADFYDRPLLDPDFAAVFLPGVINVLPMTTDELEEAVQGPAKRTGAHVEPMLVAELVADTAAQPGALPLLQFTLTELFDRCVDRTLKLADYRALGGLRGILSRRAEGVYGHLAEIEKQVAKQVFLRLVRPGRGTIDSRRRLPLSELIDLDVDPVALSAVLDAFGRNRLIAFDRESATGDATVEVAHEALLREWERMAGWIDRHRLALRRHEAFNLGAEEWEASGRNPDYLLAGSRLDEFVATVHEGTLQLTGRERAFLDASLERRRNEQDRDAKRFESQRRLERRARSRLVALGAALLALAVVGSYAVLAATAARRAPVAFLYNGDGVFEATLIVQHGFESAVSDFGLTSRKTSVSDGPSADTALRALSAGGAGLIVVTAVDTNVDAVAASFPGTRYVVIDLPAARSNVTHLSFAANEGSFLAGAAAAATSRTGTVGFIGGMDGPVIWPFEAGYEAGARAVNPAIRVVATYLSPFGDYDGYADPTGAATAARAQYEAGADVIFAAAGDSGLGVFQAATDMSAARGQQLWAIGVDSDQYQTVGDDPANVDWNEWQKHILTSMVKRADTGVYAVLSDYARGNLAPGTRLLGLAAHGVDIAYSGGFIDGLHPMLDTWRAKIIAGQVVVPCIPVDREARAQALGLDAASCGG